VQSFRHNNSIAQTDRQTDKSDRQIDGQTDGNTITISRSAC